MKPVSPVLMEMMVSLETTENQDPRVHKVLKVHEVPKDPRDPRELMEAQAIREHKDQEVIPVMLDRKDLEDQLEKTVALDKMVCQASKDLKDSREPREQWERR